MTVSDAAIERLHANCLVAKAGELLIRSRACKVQASLLSQK
jgi:hypothetical protein